MGLVHVENPCVGDGRAKDIPRQISQHGIITMAVVLAEGDPFLPPDVGGDLGEDGRCKAPPGPRAETARRSCGKRTETGTRYSPTRLALPVLAIGRGPPPVKSKVHMGVIAQAAIPGCAAPIAFRARPRDVI